MVRKGGPEVSPLPTSEVESYCNPSVLRFRPGDDVLVAVTSNWCYGSPIQVSLIAVPD